MMKTKNMFWAALSMTAALVMTACSSDDNMMTPAALQGEVKTIPYSVTVNEGAATNRASVDSDNKTLKFAAGDKLHIFGPNISGVLTLKSGDEGKSSGATFEGDLTYTGSSSPASNLMLAAVLVGTNNQGWNIVNGKATTFSYPDNTYCSSVNDAVEQYSNLTGASTYSAKSFTLTQQTAFLNFEITFEDGTTTGTTLSTVVSNNGSTIAIANVTTTTVGGKVVAKFVLPVFMNTVLSGATVKMGNKTPFGINNATLDGKVFNIQRTLTDLSTISANHTAKDGEILTGTLASNVKISIADGATVTLKDVNINGSGTWTSGDYAGITCVGDATINLEGTNTVKGFYDVYPGISVPEGKTLTIQGTGTLNARSGGMGAGIGGGTNIPCGNIVIKGGNITATGGTYGAGIGGGFNASCGNIEISGGTITATGGEEAAGIGGGAYASCDNIEISGGTITAAGGESAAGIGGGFMNGTCGTITITSGVTSVTATKGNFAPMSIGKGDSGEDITVTIDPSANVTQN